MKHLDINADGYTGVAIYTPDGMLMVINQTAVLLPGLWAMPDDKWTRHIENVKEFIDMKEEETADRYAHLFIKRTPLANITPPESLADRVANKRIVAVTIIDGVMMGSISRRTYVLTDRDPSNDGEQVEVVQAIEMLSAEVTLTLMNGDTKMIYKQIILAVEWDQGTEGSSDLDG